MLFNIRHVRRNRNFVVFILVFMTCLAFLTVVNVYDFRGHRAIYWLFMDLPSRGDIVFKHDNSHEPLWQPGARYTLLDVYEPYLKIHHGGKAIQTQQYYQILTYIYQNESLNADMNNRMLKDTCAYQNCHFTNDRKLFWNSSAVLFGLSNPDTSTEHFLPRKLPGQVWIFFDWEPPIINFNFYYRHYSWRNVMNWSMSYRLDSDISYPYGVLKSRTQEEIPVKDYSAIYRKKTKFAFWMVSNCGLMVFSGRNEYVNELRKYIPVDMYGRCAGERLKDVSDLFSKYKFYFAFENTFCKEYVTEKVFERFSKDVIVVVRGGAEYDKLFPSNLVINAGDFTNASSLAQHLLRIGQSEQLYTEYLQRKDRYDASGTLNWPCQMCAKLNKQNQYPKVHESVVSFGTKNCWKPEDVAIDWSRWYAVTSFVLILFLSTLWILFTFQGRSTWHRIMLYFYKRRKRGRLE